MSELEILEGEAEVRLWQAPQHSAGRSSGPLTAEGLAAIEEQAHAEGLERGLAEGRRRGEREVAEQARRLEQLLAEIAPATALIDEIFLKQIGELVLAIARQFVRRELAREPGEIVRVVREALAALPVAATTIRISLHPEDATLVNAQLRPESFAHAIRVVEDLSMTRGGARVETEVSVVDASVEARFGAIAASIFGDEREHRAGLDEPAGGAAGGVAGRAANAQSPA
jgi:flagellar assembly protein FliH